MSESRCPSTSTERDLIEVEDIICQLIIGGYCRMGKLFIWSDTNLNTAHRIHKDRQVMVGAILSGILDDNTRRLHV